MNTALEICKRNYEKERKHTLDVRAKFLWVQPIVDSLRDAFEDKSIVVGMGLYEDGALVWQWGKERKAAVGDAPPVGVMVRPCLAFKRKK